MAENGAKRCCMRSLRCWSHKTLESNMSHTRIIVFGRDGAQAQAVAEAIAQEPFHNVVYVAGTFETLLRPTAIT